MKIILDAIKKRDEKRQIGYITIEIDGNNYEFSVGNIPIEMDTDSKVLTWLEKNEDFYMFYILQKMYRKGETWADWGRFKIDENTKLEAFQKWISEGCKNKVQIGIFKNGKPKFSYVVIEKLLFWSTHPPSIKKIKLIEEADILPGLKKLLKDVI